MFATGAGGRAEPHASNSPQSHLGTPRLYVWRHRHGNTRHSREIASGTPVATSTRVYYELGALLSFAVVYGSAIALTCHTRAWWVPGAILSMLGYGAIVVAALVSRGHGLDGLGDFLAGVFFGGIGLVFGCVGLGISAWLYSTRPARVAPPRPIVW